jgi:hypothetical protein
MQPQHPPLSGTLVEQRRHDMRINRRGPSLRDWADRSPGAGDTRKLSRRFVGGRG